LPVTGRAVFSGTETAVSSFFDGESESEPVRIQRLISRAAIYSRAAKRDRLVGYRSMSRYDILQVIGRTKEAYQIDENRVCITGTSAGVTGGMHTVPKLANRRKVLSAVAPGPAIEPGQVASEIRAMKN
jgi:hypothetical protein